MNTMMNDLKYACRMLSKRPGFTVIALITLAIGIGANTVMFSLVDMLVLQSAQVSHPEQMVVCQAENADWHFPYKAYVDFRDNNPVFTDIAAVGAYQWNTPWSLEEHQVKPKDFSYTYVSSNYFNVLGATPLHGRWFLMEEERLGAEPVVILSYRAWKRCGGDPKQIDRPIWLSGKPVRVVGVAPKEFTGATLMGCDLWLPLGSAVSQEPARKGTDGEMTSYPKVIPLGRLKSNLDMASAQTQLQALVPGLQERHPTWWDQPGKLTLTRPGRLNLITNQGPESEHRFFSILGLCLMAVSVAILLIACLNLAGMLTVQGTTRQREIAIRMSLGGGRRRIMRQLLTECLLMSLLGGALGCLLAWICIQSLNGWITALRLPTELPAVFVARLDGRVLLGTLGFCMLATLLFGLKPAWRLVQRNVMIDLKETACDALRSTRKRRGMPRGLYLTAQTALAVVLVLGAGLFTRSAVQVGNIMEDFDFDGKLLIALNLENLRGSPNDRQACRTLVERLEALPGVELVGTSRTNTFTQSWPSGSVYQVHSDDEQTDSARQISNHSVQYNVGLNYFDAMGIPLLQGRSFRALDCVRGAEKVIIIDEALAHKLRPQGDALGCLLQYGHGNHYKENTFRVIGIVPTLYTAAEKKSGYQVQMYIPTFETLAPLNMHVLGRDKTKKGQEALLLAVSQTLHKLDSHLNMSTVATLQQHYQGDEFVWLTRLSARLALTFGAMALFLATLGIYAIKMYMVASRTPEIGIRMAMGATRKNVVLMVLREGGILLLVGLGLGLTAGLALAHFAQSQFYNVKAIDPVSITITIVLLTAASLLASLIPAQRAAKIDPMEALRYE